MLTFKSSIEVNGREYEIHTGFKEWVQFYHEAKGGSVDFRFLFCGDPPYVCIGGEYFTTQKVIDALSAFYRYDDRSELGSEEQRDDILDYEIDAGLIYAAFIQQYGIDLSEQDIHWHKFQLLLSGITDETLLGKVMSYRAYEGDDKEMLRMKRVWALPEVTTQEEQDALNAFNEL